MSRKRCNSVSGQFYPVSAQACISEIESYATPPTIEYIGKPKAGIVPHAGWVFSGATAGKVFAFFKKYSSPDTFVLFGAVHRFPGSSPVVMAEGLWETPLGDVEINSSLASEILDSFEGCEAGAAPHNAEHSIEVQIPFIKHLFPGAKIVPILVPPTDESAQLGDAIGRLAAYRDGVVAIGSTDLTHYGFEYGFAPKGAGEEALKWARDVNDKKIIDMALGMEAEEVVPEARAHHNACGAGAIAAAVATARAAGKQEGILLEYTTSHNVMPRGKPSMFVGYAGIIF
jgi:MEMO1 family protein